MEGLEKFQIEVLEMNNYNVSRIFEYLKNRTDLYEKFKEQEKSIKGMYDYICKKAKEKAINGVSFIDDRIVFLWAITYFSKTNKELNIECNKNSSEKLEKTSKEHNEDNNVKQEETNQISLFQEVQK